MQQLIIILFTIIVIGSLYILSRYNHAKEFYYSYRTSILLVLKNNENYSLKLVHMYSKHTLIQILFSTKPLKLRYWFTREEILLLNRKVK